MARPKSRAMKHMIDSLLESHGMKKEQYSLERGILSRKKSNPMVSERMKRIYRRLREANIKE